MECTDVGLRAASGTGLPVETSLPAPSPTSGVLCMRCEIRARCLGGVAAEAGTAQLQGVLAGRVALLRSEVLYGPGEALRHVYVVRKGTLRSSVRRAGKPCAARKSPTLFALWIVRMIAGSDLYSMRLTSWPSRNHTTCDSLR